MWSQRVWNDWRDLAQLATFAKFLKYTAQFALALGKLEFQARKKKKKKSEKIVKENILDLKQENYEISVCLSGFICVSVCVFVFG